MQKSQLKIDFLPIFLPFFQDFCHFMHLWNIPVFLGGIGAVLSPGLGGGYFRVWEGRGGLYKCLILPHPQNQEPHETQHATEFKLIHYKMRISKYFNSESGELACCGCASPFAGNVCVRLVKDQGAVAG